MRRRRFIRGVVGGLCGLSRCAAPTRPGGERTRSPGTEFGERRPPSSVELPVPKRELYRSAPRDGIPAIVDPAFAADWSEVEIEVPSRTETKVYRPRLSDDESVIGLERAGQPRAYPLELLEWREVGNDDLASPLLVTYCPLCESAVVARRTVAGRETVFGVSGYLWHSDLVVYDCRTGSLWSQILATAIRGQRTGETLELLPSVLTTWGDWRASHPDTDVLLPPPLSNTVVGRVRMNYGFDLHEQWEKIWDRYPEGGGEFGGEEQDDGRLPRRALVLGVRVGDTARAYPFTVVSQEGVVNDTVGGRPVFVAVAGDTFVAYDRRVGGRVLRFESAREGHVRAGGSRWELTAGRAVDGPFEGKRLSRANARSSMYWFAWVALNPETDVYRGEN
ncbi:DUF3179 domain-containing protein [Haladaptatus sp. NG-WS-4]